MPDTNENKKSSQERRSGVDRRKKDRRNPEQHEPKGILTTRIEDRRKAPRREEDQKKPSGEN